MVPLFGHRNSDSERHQFRQMRNAGDPQVALKYAEEETDENWFS